jgi:hypothetical protein
LRYGLRVHTQLFRAPVPAAARYRNAKKLFARGSALEQRDDFVKLPAVVNSGLCTLIAAERFPLRYLDFPFGVTLLAVASKP